MGRTIFIIVLILAIIAVFGFTRYKHLTDLDGKVVAAFAPLNNQLNERYSGVPRLEDEVERFVGHEVPEIKELEDLQEDFVEDDSVSAKIKAANELEKKLNEAVTLLVERYPKIAAGPQSDVISGILNETDQPIGATVTNFNEVASDYNAYAQRFPNNLAAVVLGFCPGYELFKPQERKGL